jgi:hypothetical protein
MRAGILCNDPSFRRYVGEQTLGKGHTAQTGAAAEYLRRFCGIESRRQLATDAGAARKFATLQTEYDAWRGKISRPR